MPRARQARSSPGPSLATALRTVSAHCAIERPRPPVADPGWSVRRVTCLQRGDEAREVDRCLLRIDVGGVGALAVDPRDHGPVPGEALSWFAEPRAASGAGAGPSVQETEASAPPSRPAPTVLRQWACAPPYPHPIGRSCGQFPTARPVRVEGRPTQATATRNNRRTRTSSTSISFSCRLTGVIRGTFDPENRARAND